jgi:hypothetical protein
MGFTSEPFEMGTHMCLIYSNEEERKFVISKFIERGIANNEKVGYFAEDVTKSEIFDWLKDINKENNSSSLPENFQVMNAAEVYHPSGKFIPDEMINTIKKFHISSQHEHLAGSRVSGEMEWAVKGVPGSERLMEYESKVNIVVTQFPVTAICQYDVNKFDGATILECLKVHPYMIVKGQIIRNPYYIKPEDYLNAS